ncbi:MAG: VOC family protein [Polyangiaceae bacterium]
MMTRKTASGLNVTKLTTIVIVDAIEPALAMWTNVLGFGKTVEVPHGDKLGFVILVRDGIELMLQTRASIAADMPKVAETGGTHVLYADVASLDDVIASLGEAEVLVPRRRTFYGADEIWVRDLSGTIIGFAELPKT